MWVTNEKGNLENGDYVMSSSVSGMGCKQTGDILHNYTVAKITQDANFSNSNSVVSLPNGTKAMYVGTTYHCG